jgi:hypothetical protein
VLELLMTANRPDQFPAFFFKLSDNVLTVSSHVYKYTHDCVFVKAVKADFDGVLRLTGQRGQARCNR